MKNISTLIKLTKKGKLNAAIAKIGLWFIQMIWGSTTCLKIAHTSAA